MRLLVFLSLLLSPTFVWAQTVVVPSPAKTAFNPAAEYIAAGQDEAGYRDWVASDPARPPMIGAYYRYLESRGVAGIVPMWQLLRTATAWKTCGAQPFGVPPPAEWPNLVETLQYVRSHVIPVVGPVEPVSVYRDEVLNICAGGARDSAHRHLFAVDLVPLRPTSREALMRGLCAIHEWQGGGFEVGLGFYKGLRFHVDSKKYRKWGAALGDERTVGCPQVMAEIAAQAAASRAAIAARQAPAPEPQPEPLRATDPLVPQK